MLKGKELECLIHDELKPIVDNITTDDCQIKKKFDSNGSVIGVDHFIEINNFFITIQDKWEQKTPSIRDINHFIIFY